MNEAYRCHHTTQGAHVADVIPLQGNLLDAEFRTDDFRINHFKVYVFLILFACTSKHYTSKHGGPCHLQNRLTFQIGLSDLDSARAFPIR